MKNGDGRKITHVLQNVSSTVGRLYTLKRNIWNQVQEDDWPFYTDDERALVRANKLKAVQSLLQSGDDNSRSPDSDGSLQGRGIKRPQSVIDPTAKRSRGDSRKIYTGTKPATSSGPYAGGVCSINNNNYPSQNNANELSSNSSLYSKSNVNSRPVASLISNPPLHSLDNSGNVGNEKSSHLNSSSLSSINSQYNNSQRSSSKSRFGGSELSSSSGSTRLNSTRDSSHTSHSSIYLSTTASPGNRSASVSPMASSPAQNAAFKNHNSPLHHHNQRSPNVHNSIQRSPNVYNSSMQHSPNVYNAIQCSPNVHNSNGSKISPRNGLTNRNISPPMNHKDNHRPNHVSPTLMKDEKMLHRVSPQDASRGHHISPPMNNASRHHISPPMNNTSKGHHISPPMNDASKGHHVSPPMNNATRGHHISPPMNNDAQRGHRISPQDASRGHHVSPPMNNALKGNYVSPQDASRGRHVSPQDVSRGHHVSPPDVPRGRHVSPADASRGHHISPPDASRGHHLSPPMNSRESSRQQYPSSSCPQSGNKLKMNGSNTRPSNGYAPYAVPKRRSPPVNGSPPFNMHNGNGQASVSGPARDDPTAFHQLQQSSGVTGGCTTKTPTGLDAHADWSMSQVDIDNEIENQSRYVNQK